MKTKKAPARKAPPKTPRKAPAKPTRAARAVAVKKSVFDPPFERIVNLVPGPCLTCGRVRFIESRTVGLCTPCADSEFSEDIARMVGQQVRHGLERLSVALAASIALQDGVTPEEALPRVRLWVHETYADDPVRFERHKRERKTSL